jgi:hypothetical protein
MGAIGRRPGVLPAVVRTRLNVISPRPRGIYEAFREGTSAQPQFLTDQPSVEVSALNGDHRGYAVVVNHSSQACTITVLAVTPVDSLNRVAREGLQPLPVQGSGWKMDIGP